MKIKLKQISLYITIVLLITVSKKYSQIVYVPINDNVYSFLDRVNIKGVVQINSEKKPFSRKYIAEKLLKIKIKKAKLNKVEIDLLEWYEREYSYELRKINSNLLVNDRIQINNTIDSTIEKKQGRWRLYSLNDSLFSFDISPIVGIEYSTRGNSSGYSRWIGLRSWLTASNWFGGSIDMRNRAEFGDVIDTSKTFTPLRGHEIGNKPEGGIEYTDVRAQINFDWQWGSVSLKKDYVEWGNSYFGNLILSDKAPSYPHLSFELNPVQSFRFYYLFGWVHSGVIDSSRTITINPGSDSSIPYERFVRKYVALSMLTFSPLNWIDFSLGNSFVYAGDFRPEMLIPFNFYKFMDRDTGKKNTEDGNGSFFLDVAMRFPNTFKFYSTIYFDVDSRDGSIETFLDGAWYGFTIGGRKVDLFLDNLDITFEYTRISPWVYEHKYEGLTNYKHIDYTLGHWIGQNSEQIKVQFNYQPLRGLKFKFWGEFIRKGGLKDIKFAYDGGENEPFLYSPIRKDKYIGLSVNYEIIHELFVEGSLIVSNISDEDENRTSELILGTNKNLNIAIYYGIP